MEMFTSDHLSHTNYCVCQSDNYLQSHSKNHAIKFIIMAAFNYKRQEPTYRKFTEGYKMVLCHYFNFKSEQFIWQSLFKSEKKNFAEILPSPNRQANFLHRKQDLGSRYSLPLNPNS